MAYHSHNYTFFEEFKRYFDVGVFHEKESWILEEFGQASGEGANYVKSSSLICRRGRTIISFPYLL